MGFIFMQNNKIKYLSEIADIVHELKQLGKIIVTANGSYDMIHIGHVRNLQKAKELGDVLIVGVNSDSSVKKYKSPDRPIISELHRAEMVAALECVDYVFIFPEPTPLAYLEVIKPHIHTNGADWGENCIEKETVEKYGGKIYILPRCGECSTSSILEKIIKIFGKKL